MRDFLGRTLTPSTFISIAALIVAMAGTSVAAYALAKGSVGTAQLKNGAVTAPKLSPDRRAAQPVLLPRQLMTGHFLAAGGGVEGDYVGDAVTFPARLPSSFDSTQFEILDAAGPFSAHCAGPAKAARGWACFYVAQSKDVEFYGAYSNALLGPGIGRDGARLYWQLTAGPTFPYVDGVWAIRAP